MTVWCGDTGRGDEIRALGARYRSIPLSRKGLNPLAEARLLALIIWGVWRSKPDLIQNVSIKPVLYGTFAARLARIPVVNSISGFGYALEGAARTGLLRAAVLKAYSLVLRSPRVRVVFQNPDALESFVSQGLTKPEQAVEIRGSGVELSRFAASASTPTSGPPIVAFIGRMLWDKGLREFVDSAEILRRTHPKVRFVLIGAPDPGNRASAPEAYLLEAEAAGHVEWWGARSDIPEIMQAASLIVLPSYHEGLPKVLLEAAAAGRAVVATDIAGCRAVVDNGRTGLLVRPRDTNALATAINELLRDAERRAAMGAAGLAFVRVGFDVDHVQQAFVNLWSTSMHECATRHWQAPSMSGTA